MEITEKTIILVFHPRNNFFIINAANIVNIVETNSGSLLLIKAVEIAKRKKSDDKKMNVHLVLNFLYLSEKINPGRAIKFSGKKMISSPLRAFNKFLPQFMKNSLGNLKIISNK